VWLGVADHERGEELVGSCLRIRSIAWAADDDHRMLVVPALLFAVD
jgi:hypothetical protein